MLDIRTTTDFTVAVRAYISDLMKYDDAIFDETVQFLKEISIRRDALQNDRGVSSKGEFKHTISMPERLGYLVLTKFPEITANKKNMYKFMKAFPQFCVSAEPMKTKFMMTT